MKVAIMQPYFLPYIGYFQLIAAVDVFVVYDNIKYTKKGWINRNRFLQNGTDAIFSLPLAKGSDALNIVERRLASDFDREKLLRQLRNAYQRAPHFGEAFPVVERIVQFGENNLFEYIHHSIRQVCAFLGIGTRIVVSSELPVDHSEKGQDKVLAICEAVGADAYINPIGGTDLYDRDVFRANAVELQFLRSRMPEYHQFGGAFVPWLSIIDVMMFNSVPSIVAALPQYDTV